MRYEQEVEAVATLFRHRCFVFFAGFGIGWMMNS